MNEKERVLLEMEEALIHLKAAWLECLGVFENVYINCNDYILGSNEDGSEYPFSVSFDEIMVPGWVDGVIKQIKKELS